MKKILAAALVSIALLGAPANAQQSNAPGMSTSAAPAAAELPAVRHLVYQFGYNTPAANSGTGTGKMTVDFVGLAQDGGMTVTVTDAWWNTVNPRQTNTCEVYQDGGVTCAQAPYALSPIQVVIVPLLAQTYFAALSAGSTSSWNQSYKVRATFFPGASSGFAGQVYTWNCTYSLTGKGTIPKSAPLVLIHSNGAMKQQGGRYITANQKANIAYDPRIKMPVLIDEAITFVPRRTVNQYTVQLKLIRD